MHPNSHSQAQAETNPVPVPHWPPSSPSLFVSPAPGSYHPWASQAGNGLLYQQQSSLGPVLGPLGLAAHIPIS